MDIGVIGGGSVGLLLSGYLSLQHTVTLYVRRSEQKSTINSGGIEFTHSTKSIPIKSLLIGEQKKEDCIIICVKQTDIASALRVLEQVNEDTSVIFLQNGMGHVKYLKGMKHPVYLGTIEHGALRMDDRTVRHSGKGNIKLSAYNQDMLSCSKLSKKLHQEYFPVIATEHWSKLLAEKLVINAVINPLTALFDCKNGELLNNTFILKLARELCRETSLVLGLNGEEQWERVKKVAENTAENRSSMCTDLKENRKTEIEAITGYLLDNSENKHIPYTAFVYDSIKALEVKKGIIE
ncbi:2-dehydropantoate 2-reductase [Virgibacillus indicus]|nr:2-dehydropantoate 2-reductase [Virgibacillus indicus]